MLHRMREVTRKKPRLRGLVHGTMVNNENEDLMYSTFREGFCETPIFKEFPIKLTNV